MDKIAKINNFAVKYTLSMPITQQNNYHGSIDTLLIFVVQFPHVVLIMFFFKLLLL